jgi:hypothetical protein
MRGSSLRSDKHIAPVGASFTPRLGKVNQKVKSKYVVSLRDGF